jgi:multimeric flavodoxin WrbA
LKNGKSYGKCVVKDDLTPIFKEIKEADGLILGSPIYDGSVTGEMASFLEGLIFPLVAYDANVSSLSDKKMPTAFIYTMNANEQSAERLGYSKHLNIVGGALNRIFGSTESMFVYDTQQFDDYSEYVADLFDPVKKAKRREEVFPVDCEKAFEMGARFGKQDKK